MGTEWPIYVIVEDVLYTYQWEKMLPRLQELRQHGKEVYFVAYSTLNQKLDTPIRKLVYHKLVNDTSTVFFNDEIYYKEIPETVGLDNPAIIRSDPRFVFRDMADDYIHRLTRSFGPDMQDAIMSEIYLQYATHPVDFIGR